MKILKYGVIFFVIFLGQIQPAFCKGAAVRASMFELLSNSEEYDNRQVKVIGYLHKSGAIAYELYPYVMDVELSDKSRAIQVDVFSNRSKAELVECENKYVEIHGVFSKSKDAALSDVIHSVERVLAYDESNKYMKYSPCYSPETS